MTSSSNLNELNLAENPAREFLKRLGWTYVPREELAAERDDRARCAPEGGGSRRR